MNDISLTIPLHIQPRWGLSVTWCDGDLTQKGYFTDEEAAKNFKAILDQGTSFYLDEKPPAPHPIWVSLVIVDEEHNDPLVGFAEFRCDCMTDWIQTPFVLERLQDLEPEDPHESEV